jgi:tRNA 2-thiouridine synthesizing protein E
MPILTVGEQRILVDEDGFVQEPEKWNQEVAAAIAASDGVSVLTRDHWKVVDYLRWHHREFAIAPMIRKLCKETGLTLKRIYDLFPSGPGRGACKVAGLPSATGCV